MIRFVYLDGDDGTIIAMSDNLDDLRVWIVVQSNGAITAPDWQRAPDGAWRGAWRPISSRFSRAYWWHPDTAGIIVEITDSEII